MATIDAIITEVKQFNSTSEQLIYMLTDTSKSLQINCYDISRILNGSRTGMEAVHAVNVASRLLTNAAGSMQSLCRVCGTLEKNLSK